MPVFYIVNSGISAVFTPYIVQMGKKSAFVEQKCVNLSAYSVWRIVVDYQIKVSSPRSANL
jgi:hypothetical protein